MIHFCVWWWVVGVGGGRGGSVGGEIRWDWEGEKGDGGDAPRFSRGRKEIHEANQQRRGNVMWRVSFLE